MAALSSLDSWARANPLRAPDDDVFSEICRGLSVRSAVQKHVRDHLRDLVEVHVFERAGELWGRGRFGPRRLVAGYWDVLYVCPRTELLRLIPRVPRKLRDRAPQG